MLSSIRTKLIGGILAIGLALVGEAGAAQAPAEEVLEVPEVVVGATRLPVPGFDMKRVPANVTVITQEDIRRSGARTVQEALKDVPGIVLYDQIGNRFEQEVDLRGFNAQPVSATSVLVDGVRVNEPEFGALHFDLVPLEDIERIEVIPGPSAIFGRNSLAGVINIVTRRGGARTVAEGTVSGGSFGARRFTGNFSGSLPARLDYYVGVTRENEEGFRDKSDASITRLHTRMGYRPREGTDLSLSYQRAQSDLKQAGSLTTAELNRDRTTSVTPGEFKPFVQTFTLNGRQALPAGFSLTVNGFTRPRQLNSVVKGRTAFGTGNIFLDGNSWGGTAQLGHEARALGGRNLFTGGVEYRRNDTNTRLEANPFPNNRSLLEDLFALYAEDSLDVLPDVVLTAGIRYDRGFLHLIDRLAAANTGFQRFERLQPRAGVTYSLLRETSVYVSYGESFRVPGAVELLALGPFSSNPRLKPVKARNFEVGARSKFLSWLEGSAALYWNRVRNEIFFVQNGPDTGSNQNIPAVRRRGVELSLKPRYGELLDGFFTYGFTESTFQTNFLTSATVDPFFQSVVAGDRVPLVPRHRWSVGANWHPAPGLSLGLSGLYVGRQVVDQDFGNNHSKLMSYATLNANVRYRWRNLTFFLVGANLTDARYSTRAIITTIASRAEVARNPAPGWSLDAGMSYRFELPTWR